MIKKEYRLEDYIIAEYDRFVYTWEMNMALGQHRIGNCFMVGNILIMEPWSHEKEGCLKLEYHERLRKLPIWNKSQYYCFSHSLKDVSTGRSLSNYFNRQQGNKNNNIPREPVKIFKPGISRLARYKIIVEENGTVSWQVYEQLNKIKQGSCSIESGILFISSQKQSAYERQSKKEWVSHLRSLPRWDRNFAWGHRNILRNCSPEKKTKRSGPLIWNSDLKKKLGADNIRSSKRQDSEGKRIAKHLPLCFDRLIITLFNAAEWKRLWNRNSPLIIAGLQSVARIFLYVLKNTVSWGNKMKEYLLKRIKK
ncbi:MAG: hypothetical protein PF503_23265 [Desulfobacula sp.]|jgi:hypothetical protein|nr:hypothetical protein [Desulfobacula sp.]